MLGSFSQDNFSPSALTHQRQIATERPRIWQSRGQNTSMHGLFADVRPSTP